MTPMAQVLTLLLWVAVAIAGCIAASWLFREILRRASPEFIAKPELTQLGRS